MEKIKRSKNISWTICLISFLMIFIFPAIIIPMDWYPYQTLQGWPMVISAIVFLCSLIVAINQTVKYLKVKKIISTTPQQDLTQVQLKHSLKNNPDNSTVSLVCAIVPLIVLFYSFYSYLDTPSNTNQSALVVVTYYWTIGIPLFFVWIVCGILGLKSEKRKLAIISLIIKPAGIALFALFSLIYSLIYPIFN